MVLIFPAFLESWRTPDSVEHGGNICARRRARADGTTARGLGFGLRLRGGALRAGDL